MKQYLTIPLIGLFLLTIGCQPPAPTNELAEEVKTEVKESVERLAKAYQQQDADTLVDLSLTRLVDKAGGKSSYKNILNLTFESYEIEGIELVSYTIGEVTGGFSSDDGLVVFVRYQTELKTEGRPNSMNEIILIGVKEVSGWKFMDVNGIRSRPGLLNEVIPGLPKGIEIPSSTM